MNNPPAFPLDDGTGFAAEPGMTLRDYFAAKAMQAIVGAVMAARLNDGIEVAIQVSPGSYEIADAMLKARE